MRLLLLVCVFLPEMRGELLSEALRIFPANTTAFEYDDLHALRRLPNYGDLQRQYSSAGLTRLKSALSLLGVSEGQVWALVTASGPGGFFGLLSGAFDKSAAIEARNHLPRFAVENSTAFCGHNGVCFLFPAGDGPVWFGTLAQLTNMMQVKEGRIQALVDSPSLKPVFDGADRRAPVIGWAPGSEIDQIIGANDGQSLLSKFNLPSWFSRIQSFVYSVHLDAEAHVAVRFLCKSEVESTVLAKTLNLAGSVQGFSGTFSDVKKVAATSSGRVGTLNFDAVITVPRPTDAKH